MCCFSRSVQFINLKQRFFHHPCWRYLLDIQEVCFHILCVSKWNRSSLALQWDHILGIRARTEVKCIRMNNKSRRKDTDVARRCTDLTLLALGQWQVYLMILTARAWAEDSPLRVNTSANLLEVKQGCWTHPILWLPPCILSSSFFWMLNDFSGCYWWVLIRKIWTLRDWSKLRVHLS